MNFMTPPCDPQRVAPHRLATGAKRRVEKYNPTRRKAQIKFGYLISKPRALPTVSFHVWTQLGSTFLQLFAQVGKTAVELAFAKSALSAAEGLTRVMLNFLKFLHGPPELQLSASPVLLRARSQNCSSTSLNAAASFFCWPALSLFQASIFMK